ncbi:glycosyltransferase [Winogradskyella ursingii]|uniref:glycosyltransferase n=1 Tax=Winogradskyella ursingii TaxID=2686079 RepID=UPI0015CBA05B|nr:glycosyltransferase [Winogradskyella ursingii]
MAKKICIVLSSLSNGGTERFGATLSTMLSKLGYDVTIFITHDAIEYPYSGRLYSLEAESKKSLGVVGKLLCMNNFFRTQKFDIIIDNRLRSQFLKEFLVYRIFYRNARIIAMIHNFRVSNYFPKNAFWSNLIYNKSVEFIGVSRRIMERSIDDYGVKNINYIYNPIHFRILEEKSVAYKVELPFKFILYFGRFEEVAKNLTLLIKSYENSRLRQQSIKLVLMGKGEDEFYLKSLVNDLELNNNVIFMDYNSNPFPYVKQSLFTVLSSKYEGFPMSIIESLAIGTPVVSVDCESGPREVIIDGKNGLLVKNNDIQVLSSALDRFVNDQELYQKCKDNAKSSVAHLDVSEVTKQWKTLLEDEK